MRREVPGGTPAFLSPPGRLLCRPLAGVALAALTDAFAGKASHPSGAMLRVFPVHRKARCQSCMINTARKQRTLQKNERNFGANSDLVRDSVPPTQGDAGEGDPPNGAVPGGTGLPCKLSTFVFPGTK